MDRTALTWPGAPMAMASAALFGASTPFAKQLLGAVDPWLLAGLLYLGSGIGLALAQLARRPLGIGATEAPLRRADAPWLLLVVLAGGVAGPVLLMFGLARTSAADAALLLNLEGLATMAIAWVVFRLDAHAVVRHIPGGIRVTATGTGRTLVAILRLLPEEGMHLNGMHGWHLAATRIRDGVILAVTTSDPKQVATIRGLGFAGILASGDFHPRHHLEIARGEPMH